VTAKASDREATAVTRVSRVTRPTTALHRHAVVTGRTFLPRASNSFFFTGRAEFYIFDFLEEVSLEILARSDRRDRPALLELC
jgi:hypothetical protein